MSNQPVDLEVLQRKAPVVKPKRRHNRLFGAVLLLAILGAAYVTLRPLLDPPPSVRVVRARSAAPSSGTGATTFASSVVAAGWLEADPYPVSVRPLVRGVVRSLHVLEGQPVVQGETLLAELDNLDVRNELDLAQADQALREADVAQAKQALAVAKSVFEQKLDLRQRVIDLEGQIESAKRDVERARARQIESARAIETARVDVKAQEHLVASGGSTPVALERARARLAEVESHALELEADVQRLQKDVVRRQSLLVLAKEGRDDPRVLAGEVTNRTAALARAEAAVAAAKIRVSVAQRNVEHLTIRAPMDGAVLRLNCAPGGLAGPQGEFMGMGEANATGSLNRLTGALVTLYDPARIQARVDVPLADVEGIQVGTPVDVEVAAAQGRTFAGAVTRLVHEADLSKNTLQVKVRIEKPEGLLRPEMLCDARFKIGPRQAKDGGPTSAATVWLVPTEAVRSDAVFVYDPTAGGRARRIAVKPLGQEGDWTRVQGDLGRSSLIVLDVVEDGARVQAKEATP